jgi:hypothetical protein
MQALGIKQLKGRCDIMECLGASKKTPAIVAIGVYGALTAAEEWLAQNIKRGNEDGIINI